VATGVVKFFNAEKGYGFISREGGKDVFVHYSNIEGSGYRTLEADQRVEFDIAPGKKGRKPTTCGSSDPRSGPAWAGTTTCRVLPADRSRGNGCTAGCSSRRSTARR
jgi:CspA family cold shock protein